MNKVSENAATSSDVILPIQCQYLRVSTPRFYVLCFLIIITGGLFYLPYHWSISLRVAFFIKCDQQDATHVRAFKEGEDPEILPILTKSAKQNTIDDRVLDERVHFRLFKYRYETFYFKEEIGLYIPLSYANQYDFMTLHGLSGGISHNKLIKHRLRLYDEAIIKLNIPKWWETVFYSIIQPFFVFQIFSIILWCVEVYWIYSICIFVIMVSTLTVNTLYLHWNLNEIQDLATYKCDVDVLRFGERSTISSEKLVPGDVIFISNDLTFPCDCVLIKGYALVNETMLTGESQPVMKEALPELTSIYNKDKLYTLSAGTKVVVTNNDSIAVVTATGYRTAKGELVRSILYPKPNRFNFERDAYYFVGLMCFMTLIGFAISIKPLLDGGYAPGDIVISLLDLSTIAIPPALPLTMTIGIAYSMSRLKANKISCIRPPAIQSAGRITVACFDKTGTLTKDEMTLNVTYDAQRNTEVNDLSQVSTEFQKCLAACQSLTMYNELLLGDPQEIAIVQALGWKKKQLNSGRIEFANQDESIKISSFFTYHFSSELKRMGVIVEENSEYVLFMKGAPEVIFPLCKDLPEDMYLTLLRYTRQGYRVLACAYKILPEFKKDMELKDIENGLTLLGLPLIENPIKDDAVATLDALKEANIKCIMSTGDNFLTGLAVGKKLGLSKCPTVYFADYIGLEIVWENSDGKRLSGVPDSNEEFEIVATGNFIERIITENTDLIPLVKERCNIFGRMAPKHKVMLIELFQVGETMIAHIGDGANDCGALKQADVGLSLSDAEASIAAPFSAKNLWDFIYLIREGKCALASSYQCFRFMCMYSVLQFTGTVVLYWEQNDFTNDQFLWQDLFTVLPMTFTMGASKPFPRLTNDLPPGSLLSLEIIMSLIGQILISVGIIVAGIEALFNLYWFTGVLGPGISSPSAAPENDVVWMCASGQFIVMAIIFSIGRPFRQNFYKNTGFLVTCIVLTAINIMVIFDRNDFTDNFLNESDQTRFDCRWIIFGLILGGALLSLIYDQIMLPCLIYTLRRCFCKKNTIRNR